MKSSTKIERFEDLIVWQKAMELSKLIYQITSRGAFSKDWGLRDQIRRASVSIPSNIAEGYGRYTKKDFRHFLAVANGSANEVRTQVQLAASFDYIDQETAKQLVDRCVEVSKVIKGFRNSLV